MKKLVCAAVAMIALAGCGSKSDEPAKVMRCSTSLAQTGVKIDLDVDYEYDGNQVLKQIQKGVASVEDEANLPTVKTYFENAGYVEMTKDMKGVTYEIVTDEENKTVTENLVIDFSEISGTDYSKITNGQVKASSSKIIVAVDKTEEGMEKAGYTCTK